MSNPVTTLPAAIDLLPQSGERIGPSAGRPTDAEDLDAAFEQFHRQASAFSQSILARIGVANVSEARTRAEQNVRVARTMFGKWSLEILSTLYGARSVGFEDLRRTLRGITPSVLSYRLKRMEGTGLVAREVQTVRPVRVRYRLTAKGLTVAALGEPVFLFLQYSEAKERREARAPPRRS